MTGLERNCSSHCSFTKAMQQQVEGWKWPECADFTEELAEVKKALEYAYQNYLTIVCRLNEARSGGPFEAAPTAYVRWFGAWRLAWIALPVLMAFAACRRSGNRPFSEG